MAITKEKISAFQTMPLFGGLSADAIELVLSKGIGHRRRAGEFFYHEGDGAESLFLLESGRVSLVREHGDELLRLKEVSPGDCFGVVALLDFAGRNTSAVAQQDSSACEITSEHLYALYNVSVEQFNLLYMNVAREVCRRLRQTDQRLFECWAAGDLKARN
ncbi:MAG: Crp/Fnr family transcriptional regulator [Gammaproteobacteria bacterium]|nr:Crp/Fnr family transcriptional regulator [Gammaproteobacteria bacterium]